MVPRNDPASQSNPDEALATHAELQMDVDFGMKVIRGFVKYSVDIQVDGVKTFVLDTSKLVVESVQINGSRARWVQHRSTTVYGSALEIFLPDETNTGLMKGSNLQVLIRFCTSPRSSAIQWLPPEQTHGGKRPYLFTQGQAIHARSFLPCQDCPSVKTTYEASITVPSWATCLMSALEKSRPEETAGSKRTFFWEQTVPVPSYLIALAVGDLEARDISERCRIWSEPGVVDDAASDFSQTEDFLQAAEELVGPYEWGRYDVLCMPPSFPYGGMENPCLTFVTPTLLTSDKSLAFVVAHEISHSWTGNLVTNRTWEHFWLNEGWTMWLERNIMTKVTGNPDYYDFDAMQGYRALSESVSLFRANGAAALTKLVPDLTDIDPDDAFSSVPYEKGFALLNELQRRVGQEAFKDFAKTYIARFRRQTVDSAEFKEFFLQAFLSKEKELESLDWDAWFYDEGMPAEEPTFNKSLIEASHDLADRWLKVAEDGDQHTEGQAGSVLDHPEVEVFASWPSPLKVVFLQRLLDNTKGSERCFPLPVLQAMDAAYSLTKTRNSEVRFCWHQLCLRNKALFIVPHVLDFMTSMGRMKFARPLYREMRDVGGDTCRAAVETFKERAAFYHPICRTMIAKDLGIDLDEGRKTPSRSVSMASLSMSRTSSEVDVPGKNAYATGDQGPNVEERSWGVKGYDESQGSRGEGRRSQLDKWSGLASTAGAVAAAAIILGAAVVVVSRRRG